MSDENGSEIEPEEEIEEEPTEEEEEEIEDQEDFLNKNTKSFRCLAQVKISRSSLLLDPFYWFPEVEDPHLDEALWDDAPPPVYDDIGREKYIDTCKSEKVRPFRRVLDSLDSNCLDLRFFGLNDSSLRAVCEALADNTYVRTVLLQENVVTKKGLSCINDMLKQNQTITVLNLSRCHISPEAAESFREGFRYNTGIEELDLSWNELADDGIAYLSNALKRNMTLKKLNLSHNHMNDEALPYLAEMVEENYSIDDLDLSWNYLYKSEGMQAFFTALMDNMSIRKLNVSWCGIGDKENMRYVLEYLKSESAKIEDLDLSHNRIMGISAKMLKTGLKFNESVKSINLSANPLSENDIEFMTGVVTEPRTVPLVLKEMDFSGAAVNKNMIKIRNQCRRKGVTIKYERINGNYKVKGPDFNKILMDRAKFVALNQKKKKWRSDIGIFFLSLPNEESMERVEFQILMKKFKIKLENELLDQLLKTTSESSGELNPKALKEMWMKYYPETKLPEKKSKKKGKIKKQPTEAAEKKTTKEQPGEEEEYGVCDCEISTEDETVGNETETDKNEPQVENITETTQDVIPSEDMKTITSQSTLKSEAN